jgi:hypothetical protein
MAAIDFDPVTLPKSAGEDVAIDASATPTSAKSGYS